MSDFTRWLKGHDVTIDLLTVWGVVVMGVLLALVNVVAWWWLRDTTDQTMVGVSLKRKKRAEAFKEMGWSLYWGMVLMAFYAAYQFGFWERLGIRALIVIAYVVAVINGVRFIYYLRQERKKGGDVG